jgi:hypothetical protein
MMRGSQVNGLKARENEILNRRKRKTKERISTKVESLKTKTDA